MKIDDIRDNHMKEITEVATKLVNHFKAKMYVFPSNDHVKEMYDMIQQVMDDPGYKDKITCSKKCSFCCHDKIQMPNIEAERIKKLGIKPVDRKVLKKQKQVADFNNLKWADKKCSLLNTDGTCSIYENRPLICRTHNSIDDPKKCDTRIFVNISHNQAFSVNFEAVMYAMFILSDQKIISMHQILE